MSEKESTSTQATQAPAQAATSAPGPAIDPKAIAEAVSAALRAEREEAAKASAKSSVDPVAAMKADMEAMRAEHAKAIAQAKEAAAGERDRYHSRARALEKAGAHSADDVLALCPDLLSCDDLDKAIAEARSRKPFLFSSATQAASPSPRTLPGNAQGGGPGGSGLSQQVVATLGLSPAHQAKILSMKAN